MSNFNKADLVKCFRTSDEAGCMFNWDDKCRKTFKFLMIGKKQEEIHVLYVISILSNSLKFEFARNCNNNRDWMRVIPIMQIIFIMTIIGCGIFLLHPMTKFSILIKRSTRIIEFAPLVQNSLWNAYRYCSRESPIIDVNGSLKLLIAVYWGPIYWLWHVL